MSSIMNEYLGEGLDLVLLPCSYVLALDMVDYSIEFN